MKSELPITGALTIAEMHPHPQSVEALKLGKQTIMDTVKRYRQIQGLKPGSSSIRTPEMIEELLERLVIGETVTSICRDPHMPAIVTFWNWCRADEKLDADYKWAQAMGQRALKDYIMEIASGGEGSTNDPRRDELLCKVIDKNASQRSRAEFGERVTHEVQRVNVTVPEWIAVSAATPILPPPSAKDADDA